MMDPLTFLVAQMKTNLGWRDQLAASAFVGCEPVAADDGVGYDVADVAVAVADADLVDKTLTYSFPGLISGFISCFRS